MSKVWQNKLISINFNGQPSYLVPKHLCGYRLNQGKPRLDDKSLSAAYLSAVHATVTVQLCTCKNLDSAWDRGCVSCPRSFNAL